MTARVEIVEVSPRDGIQNEETLLPTGVKAELVRRAIAAGVRRIEATSFVNPGRVPQMADAAELMAALRAEYGPQRAVRFIGLVLNRRGFERAAEAGVDEVNCVVVATETFNTRNQGVPVAETLRQIAGIAADARTAGLGFGVTIGASFGCPFEGEVPVARVEELAGEIAALEPDELALADTIGVAVPTDVTARLEAARRAAPGIPLRCHFHNTRNTGLANAAAAVQVGASALDASLGGVGGCPFAPAATGNIPTEDLVYMLDRMGVETGLDLEALIGTGGWLADQLGHEVPSMMGKAGPFPGAPSG